MNTFKSQSWCRILLIDDDPVWQLISEKMIKHFSSHSVEAFTNPVEALGKIAWRASHAPDTLPDFILLDLDMPQMDGWRFLDEFQKLPEQATRNTGVFILSSSRHHADKTKAKNYRMVKDFFSKPLTQEMVRMIGSFCNN
jgi:CheY-like chemotaxis protein